MPQVDLTSVCAGDPKVACETTATNAIHDGDDSPPPDQPPQQYPHPDYAPESFWLSKDAELDWLDRNAFLDRKDSGKGSSNPNPVHGSAGSQRYSANLKSKASLIALPKPQKQNYAEVKSRRHIRPPSVRLFPKRSEPVGSKSGVGLSEPGSPKVSCMGRVRSRKERSRRAKSRKKGTEPGLVRVKSIKERKKNGFWKNVRSIFRSKGDKVDPKDGPQEEFVDVVKRSSSGKKKRGFNSNNNNNNNNNNINSSGSISSDVSPVEPPGLGAMKRFASGRKSDAWAGDVEVNGAVSEPLERGSGGGGPIWRRREVGPPLDIDVDRDWRTVGPVSV